MKHLSHDHEDPLNQHKSSLKLCNETGHPTLSLTGSHWKVRQQHSQSKFSKRGKAIVEHILVSNR